MVQCKKRKVWHVNSCGNGSANLDITGPAVQIHVQVLDLAVLAKQLLEVFFAGFFVHVGHEDDPAFDGAHGDGAGRGTRFARRGLSGGAIGGVGGRLRVDVHFIGSHCEGKLWSLESGTAVVGFVRNYCVCGVVSA